MLVQRMLCTGFIPLLVFAIAAAQESTQSMRSMQDPLDPLVAEKCPEWGEISKDCYMRTLNHIISKSAKGLPSLGVAGLEHVPLAATNLSVRVGEERHLRIIKLALLSAHITGLETARVINISVGTPLQLYLEVEKLEVRTPVSNLAHAVLLRANGDGDITFNLTGVSLEWNVTHSTHVREGVRYALIEGSTVRVSFSSSAIHLNSLENVNEQLTQHVGTFLSANSAVISRALQHPLDLAINRHVSSAASALTSHLPLSQVFLPWQEPTP